MEKIKVKVRMEVQIKESEITLPFYYRPKNDFIGEMHRIYRDRFGAEKDMTVIPPNEAGDYSHYVNAFSGSLPVYFVEISRDQFERSLDLIIQEEIKVAEMLNDEVKIEGINN